MSWSISISRATVPVLITLLALSTTGCERAKTRLDREVDRLCAIDGGVHIYETVTLSKENFGPDGEVFPQYRGLSLDKGRYGAEHYLRAEERVLAADTPSLHRFSIAIVRRSDSRVMGEQISYVRRGGDFPGPWPDSSHSCSDASPRNRGIESMIFIQQRAE